MYPNKAIALLLLAILGVGFILVGGINAGTLVCIVIFILIPALHIVFSKGEEEPSDTSQ